MKLGVIPENLLERLLLATKLVPTPIFVQVAFVARTVMQNQARVGCTGPLAAAK
jgi:hypothetical protein